MRLVDTHCHIDLAAFDADRSEMLARARAAGVDRLLLIGFSPERWETGQRLAASEPGIFLAIGLHPTEAETFFPGMASRIRETALACGAVAIGETGLDYHWDTASPEAQREAFRQQIEIAKSLDLPFIVHQRKAADDVLAVLRESDPPHRGVMHCFTEGPEYAAECVELGMHIGFGGAVTHRKARKVHEAARIVPADRLLLETDAPFMTPSPHRGQRNEPAYLTYIVKALAELREVTPNSIASETTANAERLFQLAASPATETRT